MSENARSLEAIAADIHKLERRDMYDFGKFLTEAQASHEGCWLEWFDEEFSW
jgi:galactokinase